MGKTLLKKQLLELAASLVQKKKNQKRRTGSGSIALYILLFVFVAFSFGMLFFQMAQTLCAPLVQAGLGWMYFSLMGLIATALGIIGSVFHTYSALYHAKDNELLLSMPIRPSSILFARMFSCYLTTFLFEAVVLIPSILAYSTVGVHTPLSLLFQVLLLFLLPLFALAASCFLGWLIALLTARVRGNKSIFTVLLSLLFLAGYYYLYAQASHYLQLILLNQDSVSQTIRSAIFPAYQMGLAAEGNLLSFLLFAGMVLAVFALVYFVLSLSFFSLTTKKRGKTARQFQKTASAYRSGTQRGALLHKELRYFKSSATYMLNCGLGIIFLLAAAVFLFLKAGWIKSLLPQLTQYLPGISEWIPLMACGAICFLISTIDITSPSISLEGKRLWILQSMPIPAWDILWAKVLLHLLVALPPALLCTIAVSVVLSLDALTFIFVLICTTLFVLFCAVSGLLINLKRPVLNWSSEATPIKQSASVIFSMLGSWAAVLVLGGICFLLHSTLSPTLLLLLCTAVLGLLSFVLIRWLKQKGTRKFSDLTA